MFKRAIGVCGISLKKNLRHPRMILIAILLFIFLDYTLHGIYNFCASYGVKVSLWELLAQMFSNANVQGCLILFFAFMITDLPGIDSSEQYILIRSGKWAWIAGKMLTVTILAMIWMILIGIYTCVIVRHIDFSMQWSNAMITLAKTDAYNSFSIRMLFSNKVIHNFDLPAAVLTALALNYALVVVGGIWALLLNFVTYRPTGSFALAVAAFISMSIGGLLATGYIYRFSPVSLAQLSVVNGGIEDAYPTLQYAIIFYLIAYLAGTLLLCLAVNARRDYSRFRA